MANLWVISRRITYDLITNVASMFIILSKIDFFALWEIEKVTSKWHRLSELANATYLRDIRRNNFSAICLRVSDCGVLIRNVKSYRHANPRFSCTSTVPYHLNNLVIFDFRVNAQRLPWMLPIYVLTDQTVFFLEHRRRKIQRDKRTDRQKVKMA